MELAQQVTESMLPKLAPVATYGGSGTALAASLSVGDWQIIGVIGGLLIGLAGLGVTIIFKVLEYQLAKERRR